MSCWMAFGLAAAVVVAVAAVVLEVDTSFVRHPKTY